MNEQCDILIIGAGISGLTVAWKLHQAGRDVRVIEAGRFAGGVMQTKSRDGFLLETGPFNVMVRDVAFESLLDDFADEIGVIAASKSAGRKRFILCHDRLLEVPSNPIKLMTSPLLSFGARVRLLRGLMFSTPGRDEDSIDESAARRFGPEVADTFVSAMVSGIVAGNSRMLHLKSSFPNLARIDRTTRSPLGFALMKILTGIMNPHKRKWRGLISFENGLGSLPAAMAKRLGQHLTTNARVESLESNAIGYIAHLQHPGSQSTILCREVILATPLLAASSLLHDLSPVASELIESIATTSLVVLNLGFDAKTIDHPLDGYGFLVPRSEKDFPLLGVLFADSVFPHHAPQGKRLLRVFMGGARDPEAARRSDKDLLAIAMPHLKQILGISSEPTLIDICRSPGAIPQYATGHDTKIEYLNSLLSQLPGVHLAGNYLEGVSINDCIRNASQLAEELIACTPPPTEEDHEPIEFMLSSIPEVSKT